jgi:hypothetical protein
MKQRRRKRVVMRRFALYQCWHIWVAIKHPLLGRVRYRPIERGTSVCIKIGALA